MATSRVELTPAERRTRTSVSAAAQARRDFDRIAAEIAAHQSFASATAPLPDLERLEAATALGITPRHA